jgi:voltage-gated sodium channel
MNEQSVLVRWCRRVSERPWFGNLILVVIVLNAVVVGLETDPSLRARYGAAFSLLNAAILCVFVVELGIRIAAHGASFWRFLRDGWNAFDFVVVALSLVPGVGAFAMVARLARVLRVARLVSASPKLRLIIGTMMRSIPSLGHVSLLLSLLLYLYAVVGVNLFGTADPAHWGSLGTALLTLFQMLTLEGWVEIQAASLRLTPWAWIYFASFIVVAVFVVVNLFIAVVLNNLDEIREEDRLAAAKAAEAEVAARPSPGIEHHLAIIRDELKQLEVLAHRSASGGRSIGGPGA